MQRNKYILKSREGIILYPFLCLALLLIIIQAGCATFAKENRERHANAYQRDLIEVTQKELPEDQKVSLEDCIRIALRNNLKGQTAEIQARIKKLERRIAFSNFLPSLVGFASFTSTSDSFVFDPDYWMSGLSGVLTVFNEFANINEYKAAREREREAIVQREEACLAIILQVIKAHVNLKNAEEALALAEKSWAVAGGRTGYCQEGPQGRPCLCPCHREDKPEDPGNRGDGPAGPACAQDR